MRYRKEPENVHRLEVEPYPKKKKKKSKKKENPCQINIYITIQK